MFELKNQPVLITSLNARCEKHGDDDFPAIDIKIQFDTANTILKQLGDKLYESIYEKSKSPTKQPELKGVTPLTDCPALRNSEIENKFKSEFEGVGYTFRVLEGVNETEIASYHDCKVNHIVVDCHDGGTVTLTIRIQAGKVDTAYTGVMHERLNKERIISLTPPAQEDLAA